MEVTTSTQTARNGSKTRYIFIVGLPRTGTKLLRNILQCSQRLRCRISPETWFLGDLFRPGLRRTIRKIGDMSDDSNVRKLVDYMYNEPINRSYWNQLRRGSLGFSKESLLRQFLNTDRSDRAIYDTLMKAVANAAFGETGEGEILIGEKMPGNLYHVPTLLEWFPDAKIVHTFRDPRAIMASEWKQLMDHRRKDFLSRLTNPVYSFVVVLYVTVSWLYAVKLHHTYSVRYPRNYRFSKYEELVGEPKKNVEELCGFLEIEFEEEMLSPVKKGSSFYNDRKGTGFDKAAINRWQTTLKPWMKVWLLLWGSKFMREFGYLP